MAREKHENNQSMEVRRNSREAVGETSVFNNAAKNKQRNTAEYRSSANSDDGEKVKPVFVRRERPRSTVLAILFSVIKAFLIIAVVLGFAMLGLVLGIAKAYVDTTPSLDVSALTVSDRTSYVYDRNGNMITTFAGMEYRDWADIDEIPDMLKNALIAVEDVRFYKHGGLDFKRLFSAVVNTLRNSNTHGGSTITQQLVKIKILTNRAISARFRKHTSLMSLKTQYQKIRSSKPI